MDEQEFFERAPTYEEPNPPHKPLEWPARMTLLGLGAYGLLYLALIVFNLVVPSEEAFMVMDEGTFTTWQARLGTVAPLLDAASFIEIGVLVLTAISWLVWFQRAYSNLDALGAVRLRESGHAVIFWFVPFANFYVPFKIAEEIWVKSRRDTDDETLLVAAAPAWMIAWWAMWIVRGIWSRLFGGSGDPSRMSAVMFCGFATFAVVAAAHVVVRVTARQNEALGQAQSAPATF